MLTSKYFGFMPIVLSQRSPKFPGQLNSDLRKLAVNMGKSDADCMHAYY